MRELGLVWLDATQDFVEKVRGERGAMLICARQTLDWIQIGAEAGSAPPEQVLDLISPEERLRTWTSWIEGEAAKRLPERAEFWSAATYPRWRSVAVREAFLRAFASSVRPPIRQIVDNYWRGTARIMQEIARAKEIIDYWRETSPTNSAEGRSLFTDARHNTAVMLAEQVQTPVAVEELETKLLDLFRAWNDEGSSHVEAAQFGWVALLERPRGRIFFRTAVIRSGQQTLQNAARRTGRWTSDRLDHTLEPIAGKVPSRPTVQPVVRRTTLRDTLSLPASRIGTLPALYRLLFRPTPIEDRRLLIGRDQELVGLAQAVKDWGAERFAACLVVGARGSGKTSLLNCAVKEAFGGRTVVRGQFRERALSPRRSTPSCGSYWDSHRTPI